jgi:hypothetical protein
MAYQHNPERDHHRKPGAAVALATAMIPTDRVRWVYATDYYDGPRSGRVQVQGPNGWQDAETLWAELIEECTFAVYIDNEDDEREFDYPCGFNRRFRLVRLTPAADAEEARRHGLFEEMVGTHHRYVYDDEGNRRRVSLFDAASHPDWHTFYDLAKRWPEWKAEGEVIGWFQT